MSIRIVAPVICTLCSILLSCPTVSAAPREIQIPLRHGAVSTQQMAQAVASDLHIPQKLAAALISPVDLTLDLRGLNGWESIRGLNAALGNAFSFQVEDEALVVRVDAELLPADWKQACAALQQFQEVAAPDAVARQNRRFGLKMPAKLDPHKPLVIVIHGMDGVDSDCQDLVTLLEGDGQQAAIFAYPGERPLDQSAGLLQRNLLDLRAKYPALRVDLVTESMGGLIARDCLEGPAYPGNVDRLIMIAPPNHGSTWAPWSFLLKARVNALRWWYDKDWSVAWLINEGVCEAAIDLEPGSAFLGALNTRPRRTGISYTIIAGDRSPISRYEANALALTRDLVPSVTIGWRWLRNIDSRLGQKENQLMNWEGNADGPVNLQSAQLQGVTDFVALPADHLALYQTTGGQPPAAWDVIRDRLKN
jgi:pimeloyl-ACP methyl ester carboxylesterase